MKISLYGLLPPATFNNIEVGEASFFRQKLPRYRSGTRAIISWESMQNANGRIWEQKICEACPFLFQEELFIVAQSSPN